MILQQYFVILLALITLVLIPICRSAISEDELGVVPYALLLKQGAVAFDQDNTDNYTAMVYDNGNDQLIVGATNHLFLLKHTTEQLQKVDEDVLTPTQAEVESCNKKFKLRPECNQYRVKWLHIDGDKLYMCGVKAYTPACDTRSVRNIKIKMKEKLDDENKAPCYPFAKTAYLVVNDELYVGTPVDDDGHEGVIILSHLIDPNFKSVRTIIPNYEQDPAALSWMSSPEFIGAFEAGKFVYFVFREEALEMPLSNEGYPIVASRIGRVCKSDQGGTGDMAGIFVSFVKATITCPGYDIIHGMDYSAEEQMLYTSFTDQNLDASGICLYELPSIERAFHGKFKYRESESEPWMDVLPTDTEEGPKMETCFGPRTTSDAKHLHLMSNDIRPSCGRPIYEIEKKYFSTVHVSTVRLGQSHIQAGMMGYFGDSEGKIWKFIMGGCKNAVPVEIWHASPTIGIINAIIVVEEAMHVLTNTRVTSIPFQEIVAPPPKRPPSGRHGDRNGGPERGQYHQEDGNEEADEDYELDLRNHKKVTPPFFWPKQHQHKQIAVVRSHGMKTLHPAPNHMIFMLAVFFMRPLPIWPLKLEN